MKNKSVCILYGGHPSERDVSLRTGKAVYNTLVNGGYKKVTLLDIKDGSAKELINIAPDVCFIAVHGKYGEDGLLQGYLEMLGIPYTGSGVSASAVAFDKALSKHCFEYHGIPTPQYYISNGCEHGARFMPCVVKPAREGSTVGISIAYNDSDFIKGLEVALRYDNKVIVENFISGKEITVPILNGKTLPPIWIKPPDGFYDYRAKYTSGVTEYLFDLEIKDEETEFLKYVSLKAYKSLGCEGAARVDIRYDGQIPYVLEINTVPGMTETSLLPKAAEYAGISFLQLAEEMLEQAFRK
ncbi:MAG: D-alanine--D-alanine ligase [Deferribacteraceae bacterium]|jgi:D-alanine-D-alanine ligase|nr:D-alanine--D-alanine ligase [Deferribacteraceae bacterium]